MVRIKSNAASKKRKKRVLKKAKGQFGHRSKRYVQAKRSVVKGLTYQYRDRKVRKREFRSLWILRINAACDEGGISYSQFIRGLTKAKVEVNRKILAELAIHSPAAFKKFVKLAKEVLDTQSAPVKKEAAKPKAKTEATPQKKVSKPAVKKKIVKKI